MKMNKNIIIVLVLSSLLISAAGAAFYFYNMNQRTLKSNNALVVVNVASKDIKRNTQIKKKDLKQVRIAKQYLLSKPLLEKEIVGKYAKENIFKNDIFRKEKVAAKQTVDENASLVDKFQYNSYNMSYDMFRNPNYSLKKGDIINIISVFPTYVKKSNGSPNAVQYVAKNIKIIGFLLDGKENDKSIKKVKVTRKVKKKDVTQTIEKKAQEILLDIKSDVLLSLTDDYNRGNQLWMVKTNPPVKKKKVKPVKNVVKASTKKRTYPVKMYKLKNKYDKIAATIHYADDKKASVTKNRTIRLDNTLQCKANNKYLIGISNKVHLRSGASNEYRIKSIVYKNYIIPYDKVVNDNWYRTCDGYFIHRFEVNPITHKEVIEILKR
ncbi:MAG: flagella basal body P-ring formation protein FlgA [Campylobacterota bacterium]|nr:flagella basal body P-ring formation protein FlgA [Campylobacterota bacterium]